MHNVSTTYKKAYLQAKYTPVYEGGKKKNSSFYLSNFIYYYLIIALLSD